MTERTPLLYRGNYSGDNGRGIISQHSNGFTSSSDHRQQRLGGGQRGPHQTASSGDDTAFHSEQDAGDDDKRDRRGLLGRVLGELSQLRLLSSWLSSSSSSSSKTSPDTDNDDLYYYEDKFNDEPWNCRCGTHQDDGIWLNQSDRVGTLMAALVWVLFLYSAVTVILLAQQQSNNNNHHPFYCVLVSAAYCTLCALALASHAKTSMTDPGAVPSSALPLLDPTTTTTAHHESFYIMCSTCQTYKPPGTHHCRICNRCISRMDHHCPWMNNCIGALNMKHFILFLVYTWTACAMALTLFAVNYFFCSSNNCEFTGVQIQLVRFMTCLCLAALLFTTSMILSVFYGILTGVGTIDRLKRKASETWHDSTEEPVRLQDIFGGTGSTPVWLWWWLPVDPVFQDHDAVVGYATLQRLLRKEQQHGEYYPNNGTGPNGDMAAQNGTGSRRRLRMEGMRPYAGPVDV